MKTPFLACAALAAILSVPAFAAGDLAQALPAETVALARVTGLQGTWRQFFKSEAWKRLQTAPIGDMAQGIQNARNMVDTIEQQTHMVVEENLGALFGNDCALALFSDGTGAFVARTMDPAKLTAMVEFFNNAQRNEGKLGPDATERYEGVDIHSCTVTDPPGAAPTKRQYALDGDIFVVTRNMETLYRVIATIKGKHEPLASSPKYRKAAETWRPNALLRLWLDAERFPQAEMDKLLKPMARKPAGAAVAALLRDNLAATPWLAADATATTGQFDLRITRLFVEVKLPPTTRALLPAPDAMLDVMQAVPPDAVFSFANQVNKAALWQAILGVVRAANPAAAGKAALRARQVALALGGLDFEKEFLPALGDQVALAGLAGHDNEPPVAALIVELKQTQIVPVALRTLAGAGAVINQTESEKTHTPPKVAFSRSQSGGVDLTTLELKEEKFGGKLNPTMFVKDKWLVIATSPDGARRVLGALSQPNPAAAPALRTLTRLDAAALNALLTQYRAFLIQHSVAEGKPEPVAKKDLDGLQFLLGFFQKVELSSQRGADRLVYEAVVWY